MILKLLCLVPFFFCLLLYGLWHCGPFGKFVVLSVGFCIIGSCGISNGCLPADQYGYGYPYPEVIQDMIDKDAFGLKGFEVVESSEQGMLAQVTRADRKKQAIVFLGWEPHPMNSSFKLTYQGLYLYLSANWH